MVKFLREQVDTRDDSIDVIPLFRSFHACVQLTGSQPDNAIHQLLQARVLSGLSRAHIVQECNPRREVCPFADPD